MALHDIIFSLQERLLIAVFAFVLHSMLMRVNVASALNAFTPGVFGARIMGWLEARLNRINRGQSALKVRGLLSTGLMAASCVVFGVLVGFTARHLPHGEVLETIVLALALGARPSFDISWRVLIHVTHKTPLPNKLLGQLSHPAADEKDEHSVLRAAIETMFTRYATDVVSPLFWYVLGGMPALILISSVTIAERMLRLRGLHGALFGLSLRLLSQLIHFIPARIAGILVSLASVFIPSCHPVHAVFSMFLEGGKLGTTAYGWTLGALAGALHLALAGPRSQYLLLKETPWVGQGSARPTLRDLARSMFLYGISLQLVLLVLALSLYALKRMP